MKKENVSVVISVGQRHDNLLQLLEDYDAALRTCVARLEYIFVIDGELPDAEAALTRVPQQGRQRAGHETESPVRRRGRDLGRPGTGDG